MSLIDRFRALPAALQLGAALLAGLVITAAAVVAYTASRPHYEVLFTDLRAGDAATIVEELERQGAPYRLADGGATILTPSARTDQTRLAIMGADLPLKGVVGFELFNKSDMGLTEFAQRINYQRALQGELARTIMTIETIDMARVHLTLPEPSIFRGDRRPAKASVALTPRPGRVIGPEAVAGVRRLVAASVAGLSAEDVVVVDSTGAALSTGSGNAAPEVSSAIGLQQQAIEQYYLAVLRQALEPLYPDVSVIVGVPLDQWAERSDFAGVRAAALNAWRPDRRDFLISAEVRSPVPLTEAQRADIAQIVAAVLQGRADGGDRLSFGLQERLEEEAAPSSTPATAAESGAVVHAPSAPEARMGWLPTAILLAVLAALGLGWAASRRRAVSRTSREAHVRRLRRLLAEGSDHEE